MDNGKAMDVMNTLIVINNDRIEGYETAAWETNDAALKLLFTRLQETSRRCRETLLKEVKKMGGAPSEGTRETGNFFRRWMDLKTPLPGKNRNLILDSCAFGEEIAAATYRNALKDEPEYLSGVQKTLLLAQQKMLKADQEEVSGLRNLVWNDV